MTYRTYISSEKLLYLLISLYTPHIHHTPETTAKQRVHSQMVKVKISAFIKMWIKQHYYDFMDPDLLLNMKQFLLTREECTDVAGLILTGVLNDRKVRVIVCLRVCAFV